ncbi:MAG: type II secretion system F family protein [Omnitrophica bacterium]|nr:type II secretion system F family protein [Candidatus Omnitrophota bacterium]
MPIYLYQAKQGPTKLVNAQIDALTKEEAIVKISSSGLFLVWIKEKETQLKTTSKISLKIVVEFTRQLSTLVNSGSPLAVALDTLASQTEQSKLKPVLLDVLSQVKDGQDFSYALGKYPNIFSQLYTSLVKLGETSGTLGENLRRLASFLEEDMDFRNDITSALIYPSLILVVGVIAVFVLLKFVIPELVVVFEDTGQALPLPTLLLVKLSDFVSRFSIFILAFFGFFIVAVKNHLKKLENRLKWDKFALNVPLLGDMLKKIEICRFARTLSILVRNSVPIDISLKVLSGTISNLFIRQQISGLEKAIKEGESLNVSMKKLGVFSPTFIDVITVGESSGKLGFVLESLSADYNKEVNRGIKNFMSLLEPMLILGIAMIVGFIVLAMLLPIFQMDFNL